MIQQGGSVHICDHVYVEISSTLRPPHTQIHRDCRPPSLVYLLIQTSFILISLHHSAEQEVLL